MVPTIIPLFAVNISLIRSFAFLPDSEIFELLSSNSTLVVESEVADFVRFTSGELLMISSSSSPRDLSKSGSSPKIT